MPIFDDFYTMQRDATGPDTYAKPAPISTWRQPAPVKAPVKAPPINIKPNLNPFDPDPDEVVTVEQPTYSQASAPVYDYDPEPSAPLRTVEGQPLAPPVYVGPRTAVERETGLQDFGQFRRSESVPMQIWRPEREPVQLQWDIRQVPERESVLRFLENAERPRSRGEMQVEELAPQVWEKQNAESMRDRAQTEMRAPDRLQGEGTVMVYDPRLQEWREVPEPRPVRLRDKRPQWQWYFYQYRPEVER